MKFRPSVSDVPRIYMYRGFTKQTPLYVAGQQIPLYLAGQQTPLFVAGQQTPLYVADKQITSFRGGSTDTSLRGRSTDTSLRDRSTQTPLLVTGQQMTMSQNHFSRSIQGYTRDHIPVPNICHIPDARSFSLLTIFKTSVNNICYNI